MFCYSEIHSGNAFFNFSCLLCFDPSVVGGDGGGGGGGGGGGVGAGGLAGVVPWNFNILLQFG